MSVAIKIEDSKDFNAPEFGQRYSAALSNGCGLVVELFNGHWTNADGKCSRYKTITLYQDEKLSLKLLEPVTTKLLNPQLVGEIDRALGEIERLDKDFMMMNTKTFTDARGNVWVRK